MSAASFSEIRHRRKFTSQHSSCIKSSLESFLSSSSAIFIVEFCVDISNQMITEIIANVEFFEFTKVGKFRPNVFVEFFEMVLSLHGVNHWRRLPGLVLVLLSEVLIHVGNQNRLAHRRAIVLSGTPISVSARSNLEVERAMDSSKRRQASQTREWERTGSVKKVDWLAMSFDFMKYVWCSSI